MHITRRIQAPRAAASWAFDAWPFCCRVGPVGPSHVPLFLSHLYPPSLVALSSPLFSPFGGCCPRSGRHGLRPAPAVLQGKAAGAATRHGRRRAVLQRRWRCCNRRGVKLQADAASRRRGDAATGAARQAGQRCYEPWPPATGAATGEPENKRRCCKATPAPAFKAVRRPVRRGASTGVRQCFNTSLSLLQGGGMVLRPVCGEL